MKSRADLIEYLCRQQHAALSDPRVSWSDVPEDLQNSMRFSTKVMLAELGDLGLLTEKVPV